MFRHIMSPSLLLILSYLPSLFALSESPGLQVILVLEMCVLQLLEDVEIQFTLCCMNGFCKENDEGLCFRICLQFSSINTKKCHVLLNSVVEFCFYDICL